MDSRERLKTLFDIEKGLKRQLFAVQVAIARQGKQFSVEQGYRVPLRDEALRREVENGSTS